jgi:predicted P-loop ATPase
MGGKSKRDEKRLKELLSKQTFSLREPYGRNNVDLIRLAVLCGTSNEDDLLTDPTGNRRLIPIHVANIDHDAYNQIDKTELFMEAFHLWKSGFKWEMSRDDINQLSGKTEHFEAVSMERELIFRYFKTTDDPRQWYTTSDILVHIDLMTKQKLTAKKIGLTLQKEGLKRDNFDRNGKREKGYNLEKVGDILPYSETDRKTSENAFAKKFEPEMPIEPLNQYWDGESEIPF